MTSGTADVSSSQCPGSISRFADGLAGQILTDVVSLSGIVRSRLDGGAMVTSTVPPRLAQPVACRAVSPDDICGGSDKHCSVPTDPPGDISARDGTTVQEERSVQAQQRVLVATQPVPLSPYGRTEGEDSPRLPDHSSSREASGETVISSDISSCCVANAAGGRVSIGIYGQVCEVAGDGVVGAMRNGCCDGVRDGLVDSVEVSDDVSEGITCGNGDAVGDEYSAGCDRTRRRVSGGRLLLLCAPLLHRVKLHRTPSTVTTTSADWQYARSVPNLHTVGGSSVPRAETDQAGGDSSCQRPAKRTAERFRRFGARVQRAVSQVLVAGRSSSRSPAVAGNRPITAAGDCHAASLTLSRYEVAGPCAEAPAAGEPVMCSPHEPRLSCGGTPAGCSTGSDQVLPGCFAGVNTGDAAGDVSVDNEDRDDDDDGSVEMLGITEGWGPVQPSPVSSGSDAHARPTDFVSVIEKVKDCGWYWGPISRRAAEQILCSEPDGSFIVRDSGDDRYIFSLTFRLCGMVRHVRIEHDNGKFSFGGAHKFRSSTIVDFIENAVDYSRSGRYLFFLHRRPVHGPTRVQLLHPVSRFSHVQSLRHLVRFSILKLVRRDHIDRLPLPKTLLDYLKSPHYMSEKLEANSS